MRAFCAAIALIFVSTNLVAGEPSADVKAIFDKAIKAHGGADKLAKLQGMSWNAKGEFGAGEQTMKFSSKYVMSRPDCFRFDLSFDIGEDKPAIMTMATNGKGAWKKEGDMVRDLNKDQTKSFDHNVYTMSLSQLTILNDKAYTLAPLGESKHEDKTLVGIKVSREGHRDVSLFFDKETGLLTKCSTTNFDADMTKKEFAQDVFYSGYKDKDGMKIFDKLTIFRDGSKFIVEELSDQKFIEKVDPAIFAKPKD